MTSPFPLIRTGLLAACLAGLAPVAALLKGADGRHGNQ